MPGLRTSEALESGDVADGTAMSLERFLRLPESKPYFEYMDGVARRKTLGDQPRSRLMVELIVRLLREMERTREGRVVTNVAHLWPTEEWVFLPDVSVTLRTRLGPPTEAEHPCTTLPDLAIDVLSPGDHAGRFQRRIAHYMRSGVSILWVIDPQDEKLTVWRPGALPEDFAPPAKVSAAPVLQSFELDLQQLFDALRD